MPMPKSCLKKKEKKEKREKKHVRFVWDLKEKKKNVSVSPVKAHGSMRWEPPWFDNTDCWGCAKDEGLYELWRLSLSDVPV